MRARHGIVLWPIVRPTLLIAGLLTGALARRAETPTRVWRIGSVATTFVLAWLLCFIPGLDAFGVFALLVLGIGALTAALWRRYRATT